MNVLTSAARAKGLSGLYTRSRRIAYRYGLTPGRMERALQQYRAALQRFGCGATFPITAVTLRRNPDVIARFQGEEIEFAVHGWTHVDAACLAPEALADHLRHARQIFADAGVEAVGFRSPYLSRCRGLNAAAAGAGFSYVSNQPVLWDTSETGAFTPSASAAYQRAVAFYQPLAASDSLSFPGFDQGLVQIPVSLPDDEILVDRLDLPARAVAETWRCILAQTYQRGELFTLQLHPERIALCAEALSTVLAEARSLSPVVWFARLDEVASWWKARAEACMELTQTAEAEYICTVSGPEGVAALTRAVSVDAPTRPGPDGYQVVEAAWFTFRSPLRPWIGVSPAVPKELARFLEEQGFIVSVDPRPESYSYYIDQSGFDMTQARPLLESIQTSGRPLLRLARWPGGAQSALAITGDIDALTLWDYGLRFIGK